MSEPVIPGTSPCSVCGRLTGGCCTVNANYPGIPERSAAWSIQNMPRILEERNAAEAKVADQATQIERLTRSLQSINRMLSPSDRTMDELMRDMGYACDCARAALTKETQP